MEEEKKEDARELEVDVESLMDLAGLTSPPRSPAEGSLKAVGKSATNKRPNTIATYFLMVGVDWEGSKKSLGPISGLDLLDPDFGSKLSVCIHDRYPKADYSDLNVGEVMVPFCFPIGVSIIDRHSGGRMERIRTDPSKKVSCHSFTITKEDHSRVYGTCLTFYDPLPLKQRALVEPVLEHILTEERRRSGWISVEFKQFLLKQEEHEDLLVWLDFCQKFERLIVDVEPGDPKDQVNSLLEGHLRRHRNSFCNLMGDEYINHVSRVVKRRQEMAVAMASRLSQHLEECQTMSEPCSGGSNEKYTTDDDTRRRATEDEETASVPSLVSMPSDQDANTDLTVDTELESGTQFESTKTFTPDVHSNSDDNSVVEWEDGPDMQQREQPGGENEQTGEGGEANVFEDDDDDPLQSCREIRLAAAQALSPLFERFASEKTERMDLHEPKCMVLMSPWPMYTLFEAILREVLNVVRQRIALPVPLERCIMHIVKEVPEPPPGKYRVRFKLHAKQEYFFSCSKPPLNRLPLLNLPLRPMFECLNAENLINVFTAALLEYKVVFISKHLHILSTVASGFQALLFPLTWQYPFIPILPNYPEMLELLHAPVAVMVGVHTDQISPDSDFQSGVCYVKLDEDVVDFQLPEGLNWPRSFSDLGMRLKKLVYGHSSTSPISKRNPANASIRERRGSRKRRNRNEFVSIPALREKETGPVTDFLEEDISFSRDKVESVADASTQEFNNAVRKAFLEFFVNLIGDYRPYMGGFESGLDELIDRQTYIENHPQAQTEEQRRFLDQFVSTQMMQMFFEDRIFAAERNFEIMLFDAWIDALGVQKAEVQTALNSPAENGGGDDDGPTSFDYMETKHTIKASFLADTSQVDRQNYDVPLPNPDEEYAGAGLFKVPSYIFPTKLCWRNLPKPKMVPSLLRVRRGSHLLRDANKVSHVLESVYLNFYTKQRLFKSRFQFVKRHALAGIDDVKTLTDLLESICAEMIIFRNALIRICKRTDANAKKFLGFETSLEPNKFLRDHLWDSILQETTQLADLVGDMSREISQHVCHPLREVYRGLKSQYEGLVESERNHMNKIVIRKAAMERAKQRKEDATKEFEAVEFSFTSLQEKLKLQNLDKALSHQNDTTRRLLSLNANLRKSRGGTSGPAGQSGPGDEGGEGGFLSPSRRDYLMSPGTAASGGEGFSPQSPPTRNGLSSLTSPNSDRSGLNDSYGKSDGDRSVMSMDSSTSAEREWYHDEEEDIHRMDSLDDLDGVMHNIDDDNTPQSLDNERGSFSARRTLSGHQEILLGRLREEGSMVPALTLPGAFQNSASFSESSTRTGDHSFRESLASQSAKFGPQANRKTSRRSSFFSIRGGGTGAVVSGKFRRGSEAIGLVHGLFDKNFTEAVLGDQRGGAGGGGGVSSTGDRAGGTSGDGMMEASGESKRKNYGYVTKGEVQKVADQKVRASRNLEACRLEFAQEVASLERELTNFTNANTEIMATFHEQEKNRIQKVKEILQNVMEILSKYLFTQRLDTIGRLELGVNEPCLYEEKVTVHEDGVQKRERVLHYPSADSLPKLLEDPSDAELEQVYEAWIDWKKSLVALYKTGVDFGEGRVSASRVLTSRLTEITGKLDFGKQSNRGKTTAKPSTLQEALSNVRDCIIIIAGIMSKETDQLHESFVTPSGRMRTEQKDDTQRSERERAELRRRLQDANSTFKKAEGALANKEEQKESVTRELVKLQSEYREITMKLEVESSGAMQQQLSATGASGSPLSSPSGNQSVSDAQVSGFSHVMSALKGTDEDKRLRAQKKQEKLVKKVLQLAKEQEELQETKDQASQRLSELEDSYRKWMKQSFAEFEHTERDRVEKTLEDLRALVEMERHACTEVLDAVEERVTVINRVSPETDLRKHDELDKRTRRYLQNALGSILETGPGSGAGADRLNRSKTLVSGSRELSDPFAREAGGKLGSSGASATVGGMGDEDEGGEGAAGRVGGGDIATLSSRARHSSIHSTMSETENRLTFATYMWGDLGTVLARFNQLTYRLRTMQHYTSEFGSIQKRARKEYKKLAVHLGFAPVEVLKERAKFDPFDDLFVKMFMSINLDTNLLANVSSTCRNLATTFRTSKRMLKDNMLVYVKEKKKVDAKLASAKEKVVKAREMVARVKQEKDAFEGDYDREKERRGGQIDSLLEKKLFEFRNMENKARFTLKEAFSTFSTSRDISNKCLTQLLGTMQIAYTKFLNDCFEYLQDFVDTVQKEFTEHAEKCPFLEPPPQALETTEEPIFLEGDVDAVLDLAAMEATGFFDDVEASEKDARPLDDIVIKDGKRVVSSQGSIPGFNVGGQHGTANNLKAGLIPSNSAVFTLHKLLGGINATEEQLNQRPSKYFQVEFVILHSKAICESLLEILPDRMAASRTLFDSTLVLLKHYPLLGLSANDLSVIAKSLQTTPSRGKRKQLRGISKRMQAGIKRFGVKHLKLSKKPSSFASAEKEEISDAIARGRQTGDLHSPQGVRRPLEGNRGRPEQAQQLHAVDGEDEGSEKKNKHDALDRLSSTKSMQTSSSRTLVRSLSDDSSDSSSSSDPGTQTELDAEDSQKDGMVGHGFMELETVKEIGECENDSVTLSADVMSGDLDEVIHYFDVRDLSLSGEGKSALDDMLNEPHGKKEVSTLFSAVEGVQDAWRDQLKESLVCLESSDDSVIKALRDMVGTCQSRLAEIQAIRAKVKRECQLVQSTLAKANEQVQDAERHLNECKAKEFHKNYFTMEKAADRKKRKIRSAERRYQAALTAKQDAEEKHRDYQRYYKREAARVMRIYDGLERHQYSFLSSLYTNLAFWHRRLKDKSAELLKISAQFIDSVDTEADVNSFIETNGSGARPPHSQDM